MIFQIEDIKNKILCGDCLEELKKIPDESIDCIITSPPYWGLRDYGIEGQIGLEKTLECYIEKLLQITAELKRVLKKSGVMFWNHGDCYGGSGNGSWNAPMEIRGKQYRKCLSIDQEYLGPPRKDKSVKAKCLVLQNWRLILRMIDEQGWILRNTIIWNKPNSMPSSVKDRFANKYEPVFMLVKNKKYWFDLDAVRVPPKFREVWSRKGSSEGTPYEQNNPRKRWGLTRKEIAFNYRVRDAEKKSEQCPQFKATKEEIEKYRGLKSGTPNIGQQQYHSGNIVENLKGKNPGDLWTIPTQPCPRDFRGIHFATFPEKLIKPMILAGCPKNGIVLDPFIGIGTTAIVAHKLGRNWIGIELNPEYIKIANKRLEPLIKQTRLL